MENIQRITFSKNDLLRKLASFTPSEESEIYKFAQGPKDPVTTHITTTPVILPASPPALPPAILPTIMSTIPSVVPPKDPVTTHVTTTPAFLPAIPPALPSAMLPTIMSTIPSVVPPNTPPTASPTTPSSGSSSPPPVAEGASSPTAPSSQGNSSIYNNLKEILTKNPALTNILGSGLIGGLLLGGLSWLTNLGEKNKKLKKSKLKRNLAYGLALGSGLGALYNFLSPGKSIFVGGKDPNNSGDYNLENLFGITPEPKSKDQQQQQQGPLTTEQQIKNIANKVFNVVPGSVAGMTTGASVGTLLALRKYLQNYPGINLRKLKDPAQMMEAVREIQKVVKDLTPFTGGAPVTQQNVKSLLRDKELAEQYLRLKGYNNPREAQKLAPRIRFVRGVGLHIPEALPVGRMLTRGILLPAGLLALGGALLQRWASSSKQ